MSFLLRNRSSTNGAGRVLPSIQAPKPNPSSRPRPISSHNDDTSNGSSVHGIRSGNQLQLQRTVKPPQLQPQAQKGSHQDHNRLHHLDVASQGVISMSEVLADLRVLEQQQRDAQRQLMSARSNKEQRLEQHAAMESKLEHLKYSNGEFRAQLRQSREVLSTSTRSLGSRRLATDKAGGEIRDFEKKLNRGLQAERLNTVCRRKIESLFILLESKFDVLSRVKIEAKDKLTTLEASLKAARAKEETFHSSIQREVARRQHLASEIASVRTQNSEAENELLAAQNMEESTRTRALSISSQLTSEKRNIEEQRTDLSNQIDHEEAKLHSIEQQSVLLDKNLEDTLQELNQAKEILDIPLEHMTQLGRCDNEKIKAIIETHEASLRDLQKSNDSLQDEIEKLVAQIDTSVNLTLSNRSRSHNLTRAAEEMLLKETGRSEELKIYQTELEKERTVVENLETSAANLQELRSVSSMKHKETLMEYDRVLEQLQLSIDMVRQDLERDDGDSKAKKDDWEAERVHLLTELEATKDAAHVAETKLNELDLISRDLEASLQDTLLKELTFIETEKTKCTQEINAKVSSILKRRPELEQVVSDFVYDVAVSKREHAMQALGEIKGKLEGRIRDAKSSISRRKQMKKERKREAESVASLVQLHDETRRKNKERKAARHKLQKVERTDYTPGIDNDSVTSKGLDAAKEGHLKASRGTSLSNTEKGAEFFWPQSQDVLSEDESPAQPKSLLSAFSTTKAVQGKPSVNSTLSMDKRVHWKDDGSEELAAEEVLLGTEESKIAAKLYPDLEQRPGIDLCQRSHVNASDDDETIENGERPDQLSTPMEASNGFPVLTGHDSSDSDGDTIVMEESDQTTLRRKGRQYGTTKRGLAAIVRSRKSSRKPQIDADATSRVKSSKGNSSGNSKDVHQDIPWSTKKLDGISDKAGYRMQHDEDGTTGHQPKLKTTQKSDSKKSLQIASTRATGIVTKHNYRGVRPPTNPVRAAQEEDVSDRYFGSSSFRKHSKSDSDEGCSSAGAKDLGSASEKNRASTTPRSDSGSAHSRPSKSLVPLSRTTIEARKSGSASSQAPHDSSKDRIRSKSQCKSKPIVEEPIGRSTNSSKMIDLKSKKRKLEEVSVLAIQTSGLSSSEIAPKSRRRKKSWPTQRSTISMVDDLYAFAF